MEVRMSRSMVIDGNEQIEKFGVRVSADSPGMGVPTGDVVVESGTKALCTIHLIGGEGSCSPTARALAPGRYVIVAYYEGDTNFMPSTGRAEFPFIVGR